MLNIFTYSLAHLYLGSSLINFVCFAVLILSVMLFQTISKGIFKIHTLLCETLVYLFYSIPSDVLCCLFHLVVH